jgi:hypothetical protein
MASGFDFKMVVSRVAEMIILALPGFSHRVPGR